VIGVDDIIWSIATTAPGGEAGGVVIPLTGALVCQGLMVALLYMPAVQRRTLQVISRDGGSPLAVATPLTFSNGACPRLS
jgi:hypothetical protein